jgi:MFS family permease
MPIRTMILPLAALLFTGRVQVWHIFALSFITGCGQSFGGPAYQSMIPSLVPRRDLPNAIALNSTQFNLSRVLGPVAGNIVLALGAAWCFALNGLSFFIVVVALTMLHLPPVVAPANRKALGEELRGGLSYVRNDQVMLTLTALVFVATFLAMPILTLLPAFATTVLASLWSVGDESTKELMVEFYRQLAAGQSKAAALQVAEIKLLKNPKFARPLYWAPFVLMGDWR